MNLYKVERQVEIEGQFAIYTAFFVISGTNQGVYNAICKKDVTYWQDMEGEGVEDWQNSTDEEETWDQAIVRLKGDWLCPAEDFNDSYQWEVLAEGLSQNDISSLLLIGEDIILNP